MTVRMKDIAQDLGVSVVTVSKVLRNHADISTETRNRVLKRMRELNYQPNLAARALVTGRSYIMGLVVPDLLHAFFAQVAKKMSSVLRDKGYSLLIASSNEDSELEQQEIRQLLARRVDAIIVASAEVSAANLLPIEQQRIPYILIDRRFSEMPSNFVGIDDEEVGRLATEHLIEIGCRHIAHIGGPSVSTALGRQQGYRATLAKHGFPIREELIVTRQRGDDASITTGYEAMAELLGLTPRPDAVFCYNDPTAMGAMRAILAAGLTIPGDVAVVGVGNVVYSDFLRVPLTSVDQDSEGIGERAAELALSLVESKEPAPPQSTLLKPTLVIRDSTRR